MATWTDPDLGDWAENEEVTASKMDTYVKDNLSWLGNDHPRVVAIGSLSFATGAAWNTASTNWSSATPNVNGMYAAATRYLTVTAPGLYLWTVSVQFTTDMTGVRGVALSSAAAGTGTIYAADMRDAATVGSGSVATAITVTAPVYHSSIGEQMHLSVRQQSGSSMTCGVRFAGIWLAN